MKFPLCLFICLVNDVVCFNILAVVPTLSKSHFVGIEVILKELVRRGHHVTAVTTFPQPTAAENLTDISATETRRVFLNNFQFEELISIPQSFFHDLPLFYYDIEDSEKVLNSSNVLNLISSNLTFDLIIYETFVEDVFLGFAHKFKAPVITYGSCQMFPWVVDRFGIPANPSYAPTFYSGYSTNMNFYERFHNTILNVAGRVFFKYYLEPISTDVARMYFGNTMPPIRELVKNVSLYFVNTHYSFYGAQPFPPQVVDISGIHLQSAKPLSQDLEKWMNESADGVIYFSFGSMLRGATLPTDKVRAFLQVFQSLPQRVLWKWEEDEAEWLPSNVKIMKWLPQRDVLAHPKVRVFISHGGLLGTTEAVVSGVPILGIPMYGDQPNNVAALVENGVAVHVDYNNISVKSLSYALKTLLHDKSYAANAKLLSRRFLDRPQTPLDTAVYWTEYVIRHRGAPHLQSAAVHLTWYQYYLLDVIAFCLGVLLVFLTTIFYLVKFCLRLTCSKKSSKLKTN